MISVRIPSELKERLERHGVNVSETVRELLKKYVEELELRDLAERLEGLKRRVGNRVDPELVARLVREDREAR
ncbi:TPA: antitoxin [Candidatus Bathyarchaeota archaeon]|nr:antitoxin [Candidatus Bathyarchaeota archaeon]